MRREQYLAAIGIPVWVLRDRANAEPSPPAAAASSVAGAVPAAIAVPAPVAAAASASAPISTTETLPPAKAEGPAPEAVAGADWDSLAAMVRDCRLCALHRKRTQTVFGVGRRDAKLLVIGEAPGADEDRQGEPFVGRAGQLLNAMLAAIGFARGDVYIANILKCRPPNNRDPKPEEQASCAPYLERQIELIAPRAVLAVGRIAAQRLLQTDQTIGRLRGRVQSLGPSRIPIVVTYHPAYLLRSPQAKQKSWQDLCMIKDLITSKP